MKLKSSTLDDLEDHWHQ